MAHFAEIDKDSVVIRVLAVANEHENRGQEYLADDLGLGGTWVQTSYNANIRGKYAGIGDTYDKKADRFIAIQPFPSWKLNKDYIWNPPQPYPINEKNYSWNESEIKWVECDKIT
jgi:hypothetical protein